MRDILQFLPPGRLSDLIAEIHRRNVFVETKNDFGSGVRLNQNHVLTAYHIYEGKSEFMVNRQKAAVLFEDSDIDLVLLGVPQYPISAVRVQKDMQVLQTVLAVGNLRRSHGLVNSGEIMKTTRKYFYLSNKISDGFSGGGVYSLRGELVGLIWKVDGIVETGRIPMAISGATIQKFLRKAGQTELSLNFDLTG